MYYEKLIPKIRKYLKKCTYLESVEKELFRVKFLAQGEYNINYIVKTTKRKLVFRVNTRSQLGLMDQIGYEYEALKILENSGVTPKVFFVDRDLNNIVGHGLLIMEYLEGRPLSYHMDLMKAADIFAKIHSLPLPQIGQLIEEKALFSARIQEATDWLDPVWNSKSIDQRVLYFFDRFLNWAEKHRKEESFFQQEPYWVINNTEVNSHNFIIGKDQEWLIDWEKPVISDPAQDITQFLAVTTTLWRTETVLEEKDKKEFYQRYENKMGMRALHIRDRVEKYTPYLYLRALSWCAAAYVDYQTSDKMIVNNQTFRKIECFIEIDFMESLLRPYF